MSMTITTPAVTTTDRNTRSTTSLRRTTVGVGLVAAAVTTGAAATVHAAGVPLAVDGQIPIAGFAQMTFVGAVIGGLILAVLNRRSTGPRRRFVHATVALTALSCVPSIGLPPDVATKIALVTTHILAAAIIVPVLARHADD
jgi:hypothetical protein